MNWLEYNDGILAGINNDEAIDLGGHNPKKIYKTEEEIDESKSKFNIQVKYTYFYLFLMI